MAIMCDIYDEHVMVDIIRNGQPMSVPFKALRAGDLIPGEDGPGIRVGSDAHQCEDPHYTGWVFYDEDEISYFPEDFGGELTRQTSEEESA